MMAWRYAVRRIVLALVLSGSTGSVVALAQDFDLLLHEGRKARIAGDFPTAAMRFSEAVRLRPDDPDPLYRLGMVQAYQGQYDAAEDSLRRAWALAPLNDDIALGLARVLAWKHDYDAARAIVAGILTRKPGDPEALEFKGRIALYTGRLAEADDAFSPSLRHSPNAIDALLGLGDVAAARGDRIAADRFYRQAQGLAPDSKDIADRLNRPAGDDRRWRLDATFSHSTFSRQRRSDWRESFNQLSYDLDSATKIHGRIEVSERFETIDSYFQMGLDRRFTPWLNGYLYGGATPDADFRERWAALAGAAIRIGEGRDSFGATLLTLDSKHASYAAEDINTISPGLQQYFGGDRVIFTARQINSIDSTDRLRSGWSIRLDLRLLDQTTVYLGTADAPDSANGSVAQTVSRFAGIVHDLTETIAVRLDAIREDRQDSYKRDSLALGLSWRF